MLSLFGEPELLVGLRYGVVGLAVGLLAALARRRHPPAPVVGLLMAGATLLGLAATDRLPSGLAVGVGILAVAGVVADLGRFPAWSCALLGLPGACVVVLEGGLAVEGAGQVAAGLAICLGGALVADFDRKWRARGYPVVLVVISIVGILATVPDTERALVLAGAALPFLALAWPASAGALGRGGSLATVGVAVWVVAQDGAGRPGSIVGAAACIGLLLVEPLVRALQAGDSPFDTLDAWVRQGWLLVLATAVLHILLVFVAARVVGLRETVREAVPIVLVAFVLALAASTWLSRGVGGRFRGDGVAANERPTEPQP